MNLDCTLLTLETREFYRGNEHIVFGEYIIRTEDNVYRGTCSKEVVDTFQSYVMKDCTAVFSLRADDKMKPVIRLIGFE